jgi:mersacidin/lichenicidin family type 2 lantibiotic
MSDPQAAMPNQGTARELAGFPAIPRNYTTEAGVRAANSVCSGNAPKEGANMSTEKIIRAWKDPKYRETLHPEERAKIPEHPAGLVELSDAELGGVTGGFAAEAVYGVLIAAGIEALTFNCEFFKQTTGPKCEKKGKLRGLKAK